MLSQTCSASGCERNWSVFERIHTKKRNRLEQKRLNDLVFVQYNLRLRRNQLLNKRPDTDPIVLEDVDPTSDWVVEAQSPEFDIDYDWEGAMELADDAVEDQLDADPLVAKGARDPIPESGIAGSHATTSRAKGTLSRIPRVPIRSAPDDDDESEFQSKSETDVDAEGEDVRAISSSSDD